MLRLKSEQNQGLAIVSPDEARLYSTVSATANTSPADAADAASPDSVLIEIEGGQTCRLPVEHPRFPALFSGIVEFKDGRLEKGESSTTVIIPPHVIDGVAKGFGMTPARLEHILANMGPGQKYDLLAQEAEKMFLRSVKGKMWFKFKRATIENLMLKGVPLSVTMASLLGVGELVDMAGIKDPAVSFVLVIKGAEFASLPVNVAMKSLYRRMVLKQSFDLVSKDLIIRDAAGRAAGRLSVEVPMSFGKNMYYSFLNEIKPKGHTYLAKAGRVATWPVRVLYGMGDGLILSNLYDAFLKETVKEEWGGGVAEFGGFAAFFGIQIGDFLSYGRLSSKILSKAPVRIPLGAAASVVGAGFASFLLDSYIIAPLQHGKRRADYMITTSVRASAKFAENEMFTRGLQSIMGEGVVGHLCSGRGVGFAYTVRDYIGVNLGLKSKYDTCAYVRGEIEKEDMQDMRDESASLKVMLRNALITDNNDGPTLDVWKKRMEEGWFNRVDISPVQATNGRLFDTRVFQGLEMANIYDTDDADRIVAFLSKEFVEYENEGAEEDGRHGIVRVPMNMTIIPDKKRGEFLNWLGGEDGLLKERKKEFYIKLLWADIGRVAGFATDEDIKLLELGKSEGFVLKGYDFPHTAEYYEALAEIVQKAVVQSDMSLLSRLQAYSHERYIRLLTAERKGNFKCTEAGDEGAMAVAPYVHDLQILDPVLLEPGNGLAAVAQESFLEEYLDRLPRDAEFEQAMNEYAQRWERHIRAKIGEGIAVRKAIGAGSTGHCTDMVCFDDVYASTAFNSLANLAEEGLGMENELGMSLSEEAFDRSFIGVPAMIKAFYNYAVLGNKAPETLAKGVIGEGGRLLDKAMFARWTAAPARLAYEELTGSMAFSPADREKWEGNAIQAAQTRIKNVKFLLARKWLMAVNERAVDPGHGMRGLLEKYLNWPQNVEIRRELAVIAAYAKALKKSSDTEAKKIVELVEDGAITPTGGLGELSAVEVWIKDDVIAQMDEMLKDYGPDDDIAAEEGIRELKKEIEAGKAEYSKWMAEYQRLVKEKKSDIELAVRLTAMENEIMKAEEGLQTLVLSKRQLDATRVELARLKALN